MPRDIVQKEEHGHLPISHDIPKHNRVFTGPSPSRGISRPREDAYRAMVEKAQSELSRVTPAQAVDAMRALPVGMLELYLLVEEANQGRAAIMQSFPKPGLRARERYGPFLTETPVAVEA